jgi:flagellar assembly protein FliH
MSEAADSEVLADPHARFARWQMPVFESASNDAPLTAQQLDDIETAAYEEGRQRGYADGVAAGRDEMQRQAERLRALIEQIARPLATLDDEVERALVDVACAVARRLVGDELAIAPERVVTLARIALAALPRDLRDVRLYLHPHDAALARDELRPPPEAESFRILDDPALMRGDCRVQTESAYLDARLDARVALLAAAIGEAAS